MAHAHDGLHLLCIRGKQDCQRHDTEIRQSIAFIGVQLFGGRDQAARADDGAEFPKNASFHWRLSVSVQKLSRSERAMNSSLPHQCTNVKPCGMKCGKT